MVCAKFGFVLRPFRFIELQNLSRVHLGPFLPYRLISSSLGGKQISVVFEPKYTVFVRPQLLTVWSEGSICRKPDARRFVKANGGHEMDFGSNQIVRKVRFQFLEFAFTA